MTAYHTFNILDGKIVPDEGSNTTRIPGIWDCGDVLCQDWFASLMKETKDRSILDVGCRDGWWSLVFAQEKNNFVQAMDIESSPLRTVVKEMVSRPYHQFYRDSVYGVHQNGLLASNISTKERGGILTDLWVGNLLCHLHHPLLALRRLWQLTGDDCFIYLSIDQADADPTRPKDFYADWAEDCRPMWVGQDHYPFVIPFPAMQRLLDLAGFESAEQIGTYKERLDKVPADYSPCLAEKTNVVIRAKKNPTFVTSDPLTR